MPLPLPAYKIVCGTCAWSKIVVPKSDVLARQQIPIVCEFCGSHNFKTKPLSFLERIFIRYDVRN